MEKVLVSLSLTFFIATNAFADFSGEYAKKNASVEVKQEGNKIDFSINSSVQQNTCNLEGTALVMSDHSAGFADKSSDCGVRFDFIGGKLKVTTKNCDGYCGMSAERSMDGTYQKKK